MIKAILCDGDGTLWNYDNKPFNCSWDALAEVFPDSLKEKWINLRDYYVNKGNGFYNDWFREQVSLLKGFDVKAFDSVLFPIPYSNGVREFFQRLGPSYKKGIISAGIDLVTDKARKELNLDFAYSNILISSKNILTGKGINLVNLNNKDSLIKKFSSLNNINLEEICFVGDSSGDFSAFEIVGLPIAYNPKNKEIVEKAKGNFIYDFREIFDLIKFYNHN